MFILVPYEDPHSHAGVLTFIYLFVWNILGFIEIFTTYEIFPSFPLFLV